MWPCTPIGEWGWAWCQAQGAAMLHDAPDWGSHTIRLPCHAMPPCPHQAAMLPSSAFPIDRLFC